MPYSFTKIEEDKTKTIGFVFAFLIAFYFVSIWLIVMLVANFLGWQNTAYSPYEKHTLFIPGFIETSIILLVSFLVAVGHWLYSVSNLIDKLLGILKAESLNEKDHYHKMFQNIVDEVSVATGGRKIEGVVVPTMALNAFALSDFNNRAVIGVTEGLLARLTRAQIEAVVGHEAAHVVSGDCLSATVTTSIFELYSGALKHLKSALKCGNRSYTSSRGGGGMVLVLLVYVLLSVTKFLGQLVRMFISRQREYRADAISVRLTRDPLSLAEALYAIAYHWHGAGLSCEDLKAIFIMNPVYSALDEKDDFWSNLLSTHPPAERRLQILLDMAHADVETLANAVEKNMHKPRVAAPEVTSGSAQWMVHKDGKWQGPFQLVQMMTFDWLTSKTWIKRMGPDPVKMAYEDEDIRSAVIRNERQDGSNSCPKCQTPLHKVNYEGVEVDKCAFCQGTLVQESDIQRIIIRHEVGFSDSVMRAAKGIRKERSWGAQPAIRMDPNKLLKCPHCTFKKRKMLKMFYTEVYRVEIDKCIYCGRIWFDKDELEILQYLIETSANEHYIAEKEGV